jgi:hypothetical protein
MSTICTVEDLDDHELLSCGYRKGGILAIGVLKADHGITDFEDAVETQAAITAGTLKIIKGIKGIYPAPSPIEGENPRACGSETILDGFDNTVTWKDFNVSALNDVFYAQLNRSAFTGLIIYYCQEQEIRVIEKEVTFVALTPESPESNKEKQMYNVTAKWSTSVNDEFPVLYDAPAGIYE